MASLPFPAWAMSPSYISIRQLGHSVPIVGNTSIVYSPAKISFRSSDPSGPARASGRHNTPMECRGVHTIISVDSEREDFWPVSHSYPIETTELTPLRAHIDRHYP